MRVVHGLTIGAFILGALATATLAWAEAVARQDTPGALERSLAIETEFLTAPNVQHLERWAELAPWAPMESQMARPMARRMARWDAPIESGNTERDLLRQIVQIDPRRSTAWIALGLATEQAGDWSVAERDLLRAATVDRQYLPAWTLANFYFRRGAEEAFWTWARRAAALTYDDYRPLLRLTRRFDRDPVRVSARLGDSAALERSYIIELIGEKRLDLAQAVGRKLIARYPAGEIGPLDAVQLADLSERSIREGQAGPALEFWNAVHPSALNSLRGPILTNGDFAHAPTGEGFDWRTSAREGVCPGISDAWSPGQFRIGFSGGQSENCVLMRQALPLTAGIRYRLRFGYRTEEFTGESGLRWTLSQGVGDQPLAAIQLAAAPQWSTTETTFESRQSGLAWLEFRYHRDAGTVRKEGSAILRNVRLEFP